MDLATILGLLISFGLVTSAMMGGSGGLMLFVDVPSMMIVFGGTLGATLVNYPLPVAVKLISVIRKAFATKAASHAAVIDQFMDYANRARREGILSLEPIVRNLDDQYLKKGLQLTVDGLEPGAIESIMQGEIASRENRHSMGIELVLALATYAPALGMIGTVIGLVQMLKNMSDPSSIGPAMAVALITTFYGALLANLIFLPMAGKLKHRSKEEVNIMEMQLEGIVSIARGENPRIILEKLSSYLPPHQRKEEK